jgi:DNA polymerase-3 subunit delta'
VKRIQRDALDRVLTELTGFYRDVLAAQTAPGVELVNADLAEEIEPLARRSTPEQTVRALDAILRARTALEGNVAPLLALEALLIDLQFARRA